MGIINLTRKFLTPDRGLETLSDDSLPGCEHLSIIDRTLYE
ncbi:hypothetical protein GCM10009647_075330 [Streptomyces sanglieri]